MAPVEPGGFEHTACVSEGGVLIECARILSAPRFEGAAKIGPIRWSRGDSNPRAVTVGMPRLRA